MPDETANLSLPFLLPSQAQKHVTLNEGLTRLDALVQLAVQSRAVAAQPSSPAEGVRYILPSGATGAAWGGKAAGVIAHYRDGVWDFIAPRAGFMAFLQAETCLIYFDGADWRLVEGALDELQNVTLFGLGGMTDSLTPFYAKLNKALFTAKLVSDGGDGDLRVIINKEAAGDIGSLLLQTAFSGRAEIGLVGDDDLSVKVSADGASWLEAIKISHSTGAAQFAHGANLASLNGGPLAGFRNRLVNGDFQINQRAFAGGAMAAGIYGFDRWKGGASGGNCSLSGKVLTLASGSMVQIMEEPDFAGVQVTVSVEDLTTRDLTVTLAASGSGSGSVSGDIAQGSGRRGASLTIPGTATGNISLDIAPKSGGSGSPAFKKAQVEVGALATPFEFRPKGVEQELADRYFYRAAQPTWKGVVAGGGNIYRMSGPHRTKMRASPAVTMSGNLPVFDGGVAGTLSAIAVNYSTVDIVEIDATYSGPLTAGRPALIYQSGSAFADVSAEL